MLKERRNKMQESSKKGLGLIKSLIKEHLPHFPWITRNMVHHLITTYTDKNLVPTVIQTTHHKVVSGLTDVRSLLLAEKRRSLAAFATTEPIAMEPVFAPENGANTEVTSPARTNTHNTSNKGGRPNGTTHNASKSPQSFFTEALHECVIEVACLKAAALERTAKLGKKCRVPRGTFEKAITKVCQKYKMEREEIHILTVL
jgi:hypothetical protein